MIKSSPSYVLDEEFSYLYQSGDGEGGNEMTGSMEMLREFCDLVVAPDKAAKTRIVCCPVFLEFLLSITRDGNNDESFLVFPRG